MQKINFKKLEDWVDSTNNNIAILIGCTVLIFFSILPTGALL